MNQTQTEIESREDHAIAAIRACGAPGELPPATLKRILRLQERAPGESQALDALRACSARGEALQETLARIAPRVVGRARERVARELWGREVERVARAEAERQARIERRRAELEAAEAEGPAVAF